MLMILQFWTDKLNVLGEHCADPGTLGAICKGAIWLRSTLFTNPSITS